MAKILKLIKVKVYGKVQGVYFRDTTQAVAEILSIRGTVENREDGSVYAEAEGDKFSIDEFIDWCNEGPEDAVVERVEVEEGELKNFTNFIIKKGEHPVV
ncbi:MAG: acylphosphatase [Sphingobacteriales bacterium]|jgi:acylphosphatase